jgi:ABC-type transport system involved in multi-copper enzyme maturation permease subunit
MIDTPATSVAPQQAHRAFLALIVDTYRQARASAVLWIMLTVTLISFLLCLSVRVEGFLTAGSKEDSPEWLPPGVDAFKPAVDHLSDNFAFLGGPGSMFAALGQNYLRDLNFRKEAARTGVIKAEGKLYLGFGMVEVTRSRQASDAVRFLEVLLASTMCGMIGMVLAIIWTAGFLPTFLEPSAAAVLLVKPVPRWQLIVGKYLGVVIFVGIQVFLFVLLTWLALGWRTGVWDLNYLTTIPVMTLQFAIFYSFSVMLAVVTRNTVACAFGTLLFFAICIVMNTARHSLVLHTGEPGYLASMPAMVEAGYWFLPKPVDLVILLSSSLDASNYFQQIFEYHALQERGAFQPLWSLAASCLFMIASVWIGAVQFNEIDY